MIVPGLFDEFSFEYNLGIQSLRSGVSRENLILSQLPGGVINQFYTSFLF